MTNPAILLSHAAVVIVLGLVAAGPLEAQRLDSLPVGARLRVLATQHAVRGTLIRADSTGLLLAPADGGPSVFAPVAELRRVDVSEGSPPAWGAFQRGAGIGFLVGAGIGVVATALASQSHDGDAIIIPTQDLVRLLSIGFTGVTTLGGGLIGVASRERWHQLWPPR